jgi:hypothetical protein
MVLREKKSKNNKENNNENKNRRKDKLGTYIFMLISGAIGGLCALFGMEYVDSLFEKQNLGTDLLSLAILLIALYCSVFIQIIFHEGGHYLFGKLTGYEFISFRIGKWMFLRVDGRIQMKKFSIRGTGGQCLMMPPDGDGYHFPYKLYNFGGSIVNLVSGLFCVLLMVLLPNMPILTVFLVTNIIVSFGFALMNGVPIKSGGIANDGYNALSIGKGPESLHILWTQLRINGLLATGKRLHDMPYEYFELPENADLSNPMMASIVAMRCSYFHDKMEFDKAQKECQYGLEEVDGMLEIHKNELRCESLFYEIMGACREEEINRLYTKQLQKYIKATSIYITRRRLMYAYELLVNKNEAEAEKQLEAFEKVAKTYPYEGEIACEREVLVLIKKKAMEIKET